MKNTILTSLVVLALLTVGTAGFALSVALGSVEMDIVVRTDGKADFYAMLRAGGWWSVRRCGQWWFSCFS